jgi:N-acetylmuramoyl-L-alanine amidase
MAVAVSGGMTFADGTPEAEATLDAARLLRDRLLAKGYDVLMLRDGADVQLDNVARTVIANQTADCLVSLHWDGDSLSYDKGCFYISTPDGIKDMEPVSRYWREHERLGAALVEGLRGKGCRIHGSGKSPIDLTQTSYSTIPSVDIELGNQASVHDEATLATLAEGLLDGIEAFFASERMAHPVVAP